MTINACGTCTMCCKLPAIPQMDKPAATWCTHCNRTSGCKIYDTRPEGCKTFACVWLQSVEANNSLPLALRPDKSKVVLHVTTQVVSFEDDAESEDIIAIYVDPAYPLAYKAELVQKELLLLHNFLPNYKIILNIGSKAQQLYV